MKISDNTYTILCALPAVQTVVGLTSATVNLVRMINDIGQMALHPEKKKARQVHLSKHFNDFCIGVISAIPVVGTIYNVNVLFKASSIQPEKPKSPQTKPIEIPKKVIKKTEINVDIPLEVKETLNSLLGSSYSIDDLPVYSRILDQSHQRPQRALMTASVMKGKTVKNNPFILIKVDCKLTSENYKDLGERYRKQLKSFELENIIVLYAQEARIPLAWSQAENEAMSPKFFTGEFTDRTGKGPTRSQEENFERVRVLFEKGSSVDRENREWRIAKF